MYFMGDVEKLVLVKKEIINWHQFCLIWAIKVIDK